MVFISRRRHLAWQVRSPFTLRRARSTSDTASKTCLDAVSFVLSTQPPRITSAGIGTKDSSVILVSMASIKAANSISELRNWDKGKKI